MPIYIVITRRNAEESEDIRVRIDPSVDDFKITYTDKKAKFTHFVYSTADEVVRYVEDLFYLLPFDVDPFHKIQFEFPCFPEVIFPISSFNNDIVRKTIRDRLWSVLNNWPEKYQTDVLKQS